MVYGRAETSLTLGGHAALHRRRRAMPWQEQTEMSLKREFVRLAEAPDANLSALCRRFGISRPTGYALLARYRAEGDAGLAPRSRTPRASPRRTDPDLEAAVLAIRDAHPRWGGRKIERTLQNRGVADAPRASTCTDILRRHGAGPPDRPLPALRDAVGDPDRQRPAPGQPPPRPALHRLELLADPARDRGAARAALPPPDPGQGRALPPHAQGRAARHHAAARSPHRATALRRLARRLQPRPTARRAGPGDPDRPLPRPPRALVPRSAAADRLRRGRDRADPARRGAADLPPGDVLRDERARRATGGAAAHRGRRGVRVLLLPPPARRPRRPRPNLHPRLRCRGGAHGVNHVPAHP